MIMSRNLCDIYNNEERIKDYIHNLDSLHEIIDYRYKAGYEYRVRMGNVYLLGDYIYLDACGNAMVLDINNESSYKRYIGAYIPTSKDVCPYCGKGWTLDTVKDSTEIRTYNEEGGVDVTYYHRDCYMEHIISKELQVMKSIVGEVFGLSYCDFKPVKNEYYPTPLSTPWFEVTTPQGLIKIGKRKRVYEITWYSLPPNFSKETFASKDVTKGYEGDTYCIHAWTKEDASSYLKTISDFWLNVDVNGGVKSWE